MSHNRTPDAAPLTQDRKAELLHCFRRGWRHGALASATDPRIAAHPDAQLVAAYKRGYESGRNASMRADAEECERLQYDSSRSMLRGGLDGPA
jgi:hypothetical protein